MLDRVYPYTHKESGFEIRVGVRCKIVGWSFVNKKVTLMVKMGLAITQERQSVVVNEFHALVSGDVPTAVPLTLSLLAVRVANAPVGNAGVTDLLHKPSSVARSTRNRIVQSWWVLRLSFIDGTACFHFLTISCPLPPLLHGFSPHLDPTTLSRIPDSPQLTSWHASPPFFEVDECCKRSRRFDCGSSVTSADRSRPPITMSDDSRRFIHSDHSRNVYNYIFVRYRGKS